MVIELGDVRHIHNHGLRRKEEDMAAPERALKDEEIQDLVPPFFWYAAHFVSKTGSQAPPPLIIEASGSEPEISEEEMQLRIPELVRQAERLPRDSPEPTPPLSYKPFTPILRREKAENETETPNSWPPKIE